MSSFRKNYDLFHSVLISAPQKPRTHVVVSNAYLSVLYLRCFPYYLVQLQSLSLSYLFLICLSCPVLMLKYHFIACGMHCCMLFYFEHQCFQSSLLTFEYFSLIVLSNHILKGGCLSPRGMTTG